MSIQYTPNGISLEQIKKSAKKLKKTSNLDYQVALNAIVSERTNFNTWERLKAFCDKHGHSIAKLKFKNFEHVVYQDRPIVSVSYYAGYGITSFIHSFKEFNEFKSITSINIYSENSVLSEDKKEEFNDTIKHSDLIILNSLYLNNDIFKFIVALLKKHRKVCLMINQLPRNIEAMKNKNFINLLSKESSLLISPSPVKNPYVNEINDFFSIHRKLENKEIKEYQKAFINDIKNKNISVAFDKIGKTIIKNDIIEKKDPSYPKFFCYERLDQSFDL